MYVNELQFDPKKGYSFGQKTTYTSKHLGIDLVTNKTPLKFPVDLSSVTYAKGDQGGFTVTGQDRMGYTHRFMHNSKFESDSSTLLAGTVFAISGNTGDLSWGDHCHWDIRRPGVPRTNLEFNNFIDPIEWQKDILPNLINMNTNQNQLPKWFTDNKTGDWAKTFNVMSDQTKLLEPIEQYRFLEILRKQLTTPKIDVSIFTNMISLTAREKSALTLAIRDTCRFYLPFVNLQFVDKGRLVLGNLIVKNDSLQGFTPSVGLNVIITEDKDLDELRKKDVNGVMYSKFNTTIIERSLLLEKDSRDRGVVNAFACTLQHELCHWFGNRLDMVTRKDRTHDFDYNYTLSNYLPELSWAFLNDVNFRLNCKV